MTLLLVSMCLAFILGFAAHRTGICTVAAVAEVRSTRQARIFLGFMKTVLWILFVSNRILLWMPELFRPWPSHAMSWFTVAGGFVFGIGAAINGGCGFSTISRLAQGNLHLALTLPAFALGAKSALEVLTLLASHPVAATGLTPGPGGALERMIHILLLIWVVRELASLFAPPIRGRRIFSAILSPRYRLSTGAALIGISGGFLYAINGTWEYSSIVVAGVIS
jgi:uncharacterized membrane protein YedE/YeeE